MKIWVWRGMAFIFFYVEGGRGGRRGRIWGRGLASWWAGARARGVHCLGSEGEREEEEFHHLSAKLVQEIDQTGFTFFPFSSVVEW